MSAPPHHIRPATLGDIEPIRQIERDAARLFVDARIFQAEQIAAAPHAILEDACFAGLVWVLELDARIVGFALCTGRGSDLHLRELDVHPDAQRRGLGRALLEHVLQQARARGALRVTLTTFVDVPWNGPWYARLGFSVLAEDEAPAWLAAIRQHERAAGLETRPRQIMAKSLQLAEPTGATQAFYDALAPDYDLIYADWQATVRWQGEALDRLLGDPGLRVLDRAAGMGTQALGLARLGYEVVARDLSPALVERGREAARALGVAVDFGVADLREPWPDERRFDVVLAFDNALPHLLTDTELEAGLRTSLEALRPGGALWISLRDYDRLAAQRPTFDPPRVLGEPGTRRLILQLWDWAEDGATYQLEHLVIKEDGARWSGQSRRGRYRALPRATLSRLVRNCGFIEPRWLEPEESGFFQPVFTARRPD